jgi:predicted secreted hydrolase
VLLQGKAGLSRKGPDESQASYYYSEPQLRPQGSSR